MASRYEQVLELQNKMGDITELIAQIDDTQAIGVAQLAVLNTNLMQISVTLALIADELGGNK